jgi:hypothetical protein
MGKPSRYTHRTAVGNERLLGIEADAVRLRVRANEQVGKRVVRIAGDEFIGRLLQHVLPSQAFMRRLAALEINTCPHCRNGRLRCGAIAGTATQHHIGSALGFCLSGAAMNSGWHGQKQRLQSLRASGCGASCAKAGITAAKLRPRLPRTSRQRAHASRVG